MKAHPLLVQRHLHVRPLLRECGELLVRLYEGRRDILYRIICGSYRDAP